MEDETKDGVRKIASDDISASIMVLIDKYLDTHGHDGFSRAATMCMFTGAMAGIVESFRLRALLPTDDDRMTEIFELARKAVFETFESRFPDKLN